MSDFREIDTDELMELIAKEQPIHLIDIREDHEVKNGIIPEANHIKMGEIPYRLAELDKSTEYFIICRSGVRSLDVCQFLHENGYKAVNVRGGMNAWQGEICFR